MSQTRLHVLLAMGAYVVGWVLSVASCRFHAPSPADADSFTPPPSPPEEGGLGEAASGVDNSGEGSSDTSSHHRVHPAPAAAALSTAMGAADSPADDATGAATNVGPSSGGSSSGVDVAGAFSHHGQAPPTVATSFSPESSNSGNMARPSCPFLPGASASSMMHAGALPPGFSPLSFLSHVPQLTPIPAGTPERPRGFVLPLSMGGMEATAAAVANTAPRTDLQLPRRESQPASASHGSFPRHNYSPVQLSSVAGHSASSSLVDYLRDQHESLQNQHYAARDQAARAETRAEMLSTQLADERGRHGQVHAEMSAVLHGQRQALAESQRAHEIDSAARDVALRGAEDFRRELAASRALVDRLRAPDGLGSQASTPRSEGSVSASVQSGAALSEARVREHAMQVELAATLVQVETLRVEIRERDGHVASVGSMEQLNAELLTSAADLVELERREASLRLQLNVMSADRVELDRAEVSLRSQLDVALAREAH